MRSVLMISSHVAYGAVGQSATAAPLQAAGIEVVTLPTVLLSNHPGYARSSRVAVAPNALRDMTAALDANGWLAKFDAIFTGYLPSAGHVEEVGQIVDRMRQLKPGLLYVSDPILGDDPRGLYIDASAADAVKQILVPRADVLVPNRFELSWLSGIDVRSPKDAAAAARILGLAKVCATSVPYATSKLANVVVTADGAFTASVAKRDYAPHGTGDYFAGCLAADMVRGIPDEIALGRATGAVDHALDVSRDEDRILLAILDGVGGAAPIATERLS